MKNPFLVAIIAYLLGNFSSAYLLGMIFKKKDIRSYGSGNAGATNALRVFGKEIGIIALVSDVLKGLIAVYIGGLILGEQGKLISALFVVVGHNWPVFLSFKGGKGIATSLGAIALLHWPTIAITAIIGILFIAKTRYVSLGSLIGSVIIPIIGIVMNRPFNKGFFTITLILSLMSIFQHRSNLKRLIQGEESKLTEK